MIEAKQAGITADMVRAQLFYCPTTGGFRRKSTGNRTGQEKSGYLVIRIFDRKFFAHRLAFLLTHGYWPNGVVDHINRDRMDNRPCNLRDVTPTENARNRGKWGRNK